MHDVSHTFLPISFNWDLTKGPCTDLQHISFFWEFRFETFHQPPADNHFHLQERRAAARLPGYFAPLEAAKLEVFVCHVVD